MLRAQVTAIRERVASAAVALLCVLSVMAPQEPAYATVPLVPNVALMVERDEAIVHRVSVVGKDQRRLLPQMVDAPLRHAADSVGIIAHTNGFACTAFCVASNVIATNAHCIANREAGRRPIDLNRAQFWLNPSRPRNRRLLSRLRIGDRKQPLASVYTGVMSGNFTRATLHKDWALVKLASPICANYHVDVLDAPKREILEAARRKKLFLIGYHGDKKMRGKWISERCSIIAGRRVNAFRISQAVARQHLLLHTCDATRGASGSPIFMATSSGHAVVGINSGHVSYATYRRNLNTGRRKLLSSRLANTAVKSSAFVAGVARFRNEQPVRSADQMRRLQIHLRQAGYLKGRADGRFGPQTRRAIRRLEVRRKMAPLGLPTLRLLHDLDREASSALASGGQEITSVLNEAASKVGADDRELTGSGVQKASGAKPAREAAVPPLPVAVERASTTGSKARRQAPAVAAGQRHR